MKTKLRGSEPFVSKAVRRTEMQSVVTISSYFANVNVTIRRLILFGHDLIMSLLAIVLALNVRFDSLFPISEFVTYLPAIAITLMLRCILFYGVGVYRPLLRYSNAEIVAVALRAVGLSELLAIALGWILPTEDLPRSVRIMSGLLTITGIICSRYVMSSMLRAEDARRLARPRGKTDAPPGEAIVRERVIIYGAGAAGFSLSQQLDGEHRYEVVAFIDDSPTLHGRKLNAIPIYPPYRLAKVAVQHQVKTVLLAIPSARQSDRQRILQFLKTLPLTIKTVPTIQDILSGKLALSQIRNIDIADLLGREEVLPNPQLLKTDITDKVVLVTGAGGSIGSELCRQVIQQQPRHIILYELNEYALYAIDLELAEAFPNIQRTAFLGSVTDAKRLTDIFQQHGVETVYHAAAYKHVPLVEGNPAQGILNNSLGTLVTAEAAIAAQVKTFVLISTDKAVRPTNIMGTTKRVAELILQALAAQPDLPTRFVIVRFGNVLDSSGSVVPRFRKQIAELKPITLTHRDVTRYFMSIPEAARLVIQAGAMGKGGEVFLLDMGDPIRIYDLAVQMIELSGLTPGHDIDIHVTGLRPGEKLYEELLIGGDNVMNTRHPKIFAATEAMIAWAQLEPMLDRLFAAAQQNRREEAIATLKTLVPEYQPRSSERTTVKPQKIAS